jgi:hypothetical protein
MGREKAKKKGMMGRGVGLFASMVIYTFTGFSNSGPSYKNRYFRQSYSSASSLLRHHFFIFPSTFHRTTNDDRYKRRTTTNKR